MALLADTQSTASFLLADRPNQAKRRLFQLEKVYHSFKSSGGFALSTNEIGFLLVIQDMCLMIAQLCFFPSAVQCLPC
jgi:hypothetical protein